MRHLISYLLSVGIPLAGLLGVLRGGATDPGAAGRSRRRLLAGLHRPFLAARDQGLLRLHRMGRRAALVERQGRAQRHLLLRHQPVARGVAAAAASRRDVHLGGRRRLVSRHDAPRRHPLHVLGELVRHAGEDRAVRRRRARQAHRACTASWCAGRRRCRSGSSRSNRCDFGDEILAHPLDDDYHKARSPIWSKVKAPFLSAANWGGQPLHPRGNFEGFVRAAAKDKWLEVHGIEHWTHFYTDYGRELQLQASSTISCTARTTAGTSSRACCCRCATSTSSSNAPRTNGRSRARKWTKLYLDPASGALGEKRAAGKAVKQLRAPWATASPS